MTKLEGLSTSKRRPAARIRAFEQRAREHAADQHRAIETLKTEIAELQQAKRDLLRTRSFLDVIVESVPAMLLVRNIEDGKCIYLNRAGEQLLGCDRGAMIGKTAKQMMPKADAKLINRQDTQVLSSGKPYQMYEFPFRTRELGVRIIRSIKCPLFDESGQPKFILSFSEDVTEQRQTEEELRQAHKMEALGQLTSGLAHDFNNLLAVIIGNLDVLSELRSGDQGQEELVQAALSAAISGGDLTRSLLAFARQQPLLPELLDVNELIEETSKLLMRTLGSNVEITLDLSPAVARILADRVQLETALANLATNARDAMPVGGRITIRTYGRRLDQHYPGSQQGVKHGDYVVIEVNDTGQGMSAEIMKKIFDPFFTTKEFGKGTGLGLSMIFGFMKQTGGQITVDSEPGCDTTFRLYFPTGQRPSLPLALEARSSQSSAKTGGTVLVVEDNAKLRKIAVKQLMGLGFRVIDVNNAQSALDVLETQGPVDMLFTDIMLSGGIDGCTLACEVTSRWPSVKILLTSGLPGPHLDKTVGLAPNVRLLKKPYRKEKLARTVQEVLSVDGDAED